MKGQSVSEILYAKLKILILVDIESILVVNKVVISLVDLEKVSRIFIRGIINYY